MSAGQNALAAALLLIFVPASGYSQKSKSSDSIEPFLGRWDVTLKTPDREYPTWLELTQQDGQLKARMVSRWGHARMLPKVELKNGHLRFVSPKEEEDRKDTDMVFEGELSGSTLVGTTSGPDGTPWKWTGERAPSLKRAYAPKWGKPTQLFDGKDLAGWNLSDPKGNTWKVENGQLISPGHGANLITTAQFQDFKLHLEFNCAPKSNSGVYLRGRYEVQIEDDPVPEAPSQRTGGVYGFLAPSPEPPRRPGEWQTYDLTLVGRTVTVVLNGQTIIDKQEIPGVTGDALDSHEGLPAPIYLQGSEDGHVAFRNIVLTPATNAQ
jgi:hypothetical protein